MHLKVLRNMRSAAAIHHLVEDRYAGDVTKVFNLYHDWHEKGQQIPLTEFFNVGNF